MSSGDPAPSLSEFRALARDRRVIPVTRRLMADAETPVGIYRKLARGRPGTFLLESAEHGGVWSRYSIVGAKSHAVLTESEGNARWMGGEPPAGVPTDGDPLEVLEQVLRAAAHATAAWFAALDGGPRRIRRVRRGSTLGAVAEHCP